MVCIKLKQGWLATPAFFCAFCDEVGDRWNFLLLHSFFARNYFVVKVVLVDAICVVIGF